MKKVILSLALLNSILLWANPSNPTVVAGNATFTEENQRLDITATSDRTIINWETFSLDRSDTTNIAVPSKNSAVLNRVTGSYQSSIGGRILSNGQVYLINPNGIMVTDQGYIDVNSFLASTLDVADNEFLLGSDMTFMGISPAAISNQGFITASEGDIFFIARHIENTAEMEAHEGVIGMGAGLEVILRPNESERILIVPSQGASAGTGIDQTGTLSAIQAEMKADGNLYALAINHTGTTESIGYNFEGGRIFLVAKGGTTTLQKFSEMHALKGDMTGGEISILGTNVNVLDDSHINASSESGGGFIYIGGSMGGQVPNVYNATNVVTGPGIEAFVDAEYFGNGGEISVFATGTANVGGLLSATGGILNGNGGNVEVSGQTDLIFNATVDTNAIFGTTGSLTIDPTNIILSNNPTYGEGVTQGIFSGKGCHSNLRIRDIQKSLKNNNVIITTTPGSGGEGNITLVDPAVILSKNGNSLTIHADTDISFEAPLTFVDKTIKGNQAALTLISGKDIHINDRLTLKNTNRLYMKAKDGVYVKREGKESGNMDFGIHGTKKMTDIILNP